MNWTNVFSLLGVGFLGSAIIHIWMFEEDENLLAAVNSGTSETIQTVVYDSQQSKSIMTDSSGSALVDFGSDTNSDKFTLLKLKQDQLIDDSLQNSKKLLDSTSIVAVQNKKRPSSIPISIPGTRFPGINTVSM